MKPIRPNDGSAVEVEHSDGSRKTVLVRLIPRDEVPRYAEVLVTADCDETRECGFYVGRDAAWAKSLTDDSFERLIEEGQRLNFERFESFLRRQNRKLAAVNKNETLMKLAKSAGFTAPNTPSGN